jgi:hypothetical protein
MMQMAQLIRFLLQNYSLTFPALGLLAAVVSLATRPRPWRPGGVTEALLSYYILFGVGFLNLYNFVMHVFFGPMAARFIGWADSPFQREVGFASLGFAVVGLLGFRGSFDMRMAAIVGPACFLWGAAAGHILEIMTAGNHAPGNSGIVLYTDLALPVLGFVLLYLARR